MSLLVILLAPCAWASPSAAELLSQSAFRTADVFEEVHGESSSHDLKIGGNSGLHGDASPSSFAEDETKVLSTAKTARLGNTTSAREELKNLAQDLASSNDKDAEEFMPSINLSAFVPAALKDAAVKTQEQDQIMQSAVAEMAPKAPNALLNVVKATDAEISKDVEKRNVEDAKVMNEKMPILDSVTSLFPKVEAESKEVHTEPAGGILDNLQAEVDKITEERSGRGPLLDNLHGAEAKLHEHKIPNFHSNSKGSAHSPGSKGTHSRNTSGHSHRDSPSAANTSHRGSGRLIRKSHDGDLQHIFGLMGGDPTRPLPTRPFTHSGPRQSPKNISHHSSNSTSNISKGNASKINGTESPGEWGGGDLARNTRRRGNDDRDPGVGEGEEKIEEPPRGKDSTLPAKISNTKTNHGKKPPPTSKNVEKAPPVPEHRHHGDVLPNITNPIVGSVEFAGEVLGRASQMRRRGTSRVDPGVGVQIKRRPKGSTAKTAHQHAAQAAAGEAQQAKAREPEPQQAKAGEPEAPPESKSKAVEQDSAASTKSLAAYERSKAKTALDEAQNLLHKMDDSLARTPTLRRQPPALDATDSAATDGKGGRNGRRAYLAAVAAADEASVVTEKESEAVHQLEGELQDARTTERGLEKERLKAEQIEVTIEDAEDAARNRVTVLMDTLAKERGKAAGDGSFPERRGQETRRAVA